MGWWFAVHDRVAAYSLNKSWKPLGDVDSCRRWNFAALLFDWLILIRYLVTPAGRHFHGVLAIQHRRRLAERLHSLVSDVIWAADIYLLRVKVPVSYDSVIKDYLSPAIERSGDWERPALRRWPDNGEIHAADKVFVIVLMVRCLLTGARNYPPAPRLLRLYLNVEAFRQRTAEKKVAHFEPWHVEPSERAAIRTCIAKK